MRPAKVCNICVGSSFTQLHHLVETCPVLASCLQHIDNQVGAQSTAATHDNVALAPLLEALALKSRENSEVMVGPFGADDHCDDPDSWDGSTHAEGSSGRLLDVFT